MIQEVYCSFETAKLLKEKGFNEQCLMGCSFTNHEPISFIPYCINSGIGERVYSVPTLQMAMKWLRKKYRLFITVAPFSKIDGCFYYSYTIIHLHNSKCDTEYKSDRFNSPEEAIEDAMQYCLTNLI